MRAAMSRGRGHRTLKNLANFWRRTASEKGCRLSRDLTSVSSWRQRPRRTLQIFGRTMLLEEVTDLVERLKMKSVQLKAIPSRTLQTFGEGSYDRQRRSPAHKIGRKDRR
ncbi:uncharacterized protein LOC143212522 isoform X2 [Lasioglossum baleicum]|uniref:uncharacterized protein LOC143212522 isoform X2 n=1 Tax=Lasioglossum baleicum TaxID=434251 RepID=UPI003FCC50C6